MFNGAQYPIVWYLFVVEDSPLANASTLAKAKSDITSDFRALYTLNPAIKANATTKVAFKIFFFILFLVKKIIIIHIFILFSERTPPQKKQKYRLLILIIYTTFTSDLTSFSFRREPQGGKNRLSAKKMNFFPSAFYSH